MRRWGWPLVTAAGVSAAALLLSIAGLAALLGQAGPFMGSTLLGFATGHDQRAFDLLAHRPTPAGLAKAGAESEMALALSPYDNAARMRLLFADTTRHGRLTPAGLALFARSYDLIPYDYTVAAWRIGFGLEHWATLTPDLRSAVFAEALAFGRAGSQDVNVRAVLSNVRDPQGRLAAALWLQTLKR